jgi:hypothetical protein
MRSDLDVVRKHWPNASVFYLERDHRTELEVAHFHRYVHSPVEIQVVPTFATDVTIQRIAILVANLTARWA